MNIFHNEFWIVAKGLISISFLAFFGKLYDGLLFMIDNIIPSNIHQICSDLKDIVWVITAILVMIKVGYQIIKIRKDVSSNKNNDSQG